MAAIRFEDVTKKYGATTALDRISLAVEAGEMFGLIGLDGGRIEVLGKDPTREHRAITAVLGYLSQRFSLYGDLTIDENIAFFAEIHGVARYQPARDRLLEMTQL